jgi:hypothetical protein
VCVCVCHPPFCGDGCDDQTPAERMDALRQRHPALDEAALPIGVAMDELEPGVRPAGSAGSEV